MKHETFFALCHNGCKPYKPKINRKRQAGIVLTALGGEALLPMGITGFILSKFVKWKPLFMYQ